ncbi:MAG: hypothetical protein KatS3mg108_1890 [Isosphaeraceae bacterium]|nr:MAG: hypothetical protein KatS3mg108_1890 [Isosphaeraceae bacterium]
MKSRSGRLRHWALAVGLACGGGGPTVSGQEPVTGAPVAPAVGRRPVSAVPQPFYLNPAMNPYLNPYLTTTTMTPDAALLYLLAAQNARGGIGSGQLSGVRAVEAGRSARADDPGTSAVPPSGYRRYFQRGLGATGGERSYFQRGLGRFNR